jgi:hypothetical protein
MISLSRITQISGSLDQQMVFSIVPETDIPAISIYENHLNNDINISIIPIMAPRIEARSPLSQLKILSIKILKIKKIKPTISSGLLIIYDGATIKRCLKR